MPRPRRIQISLKFCVTSIAMTIVIFKIQKSPNSKTVGAFILYACIYTVSNYMSLAITGCSTFQTQVGELYVLRAQLLLFSVRYKIG